MKQARGLVALLVLTLTASGGLATGIIDDFEHLTMVEMCDLLPTDQSFLRPNTCNYWVRCPGNGTIMEEGTCATGLYYNKEEGRCTMASNVKCPYLNVDNSNPVVNACLNEDDGTFLADPTSNTCQGYLLCKNHREVKANCPNQLIFNPFSRSCVYATQYNCPGSTIKTTSPVCRALPNNTRLANEEHCHKYYICQNDVLHERECAAQMAYDAVLGRCVAIANVTCYGKATLPPPENTFCLVNGTMARQGYFADDESCGHYYICKAPTNGKHDINPQHLACPVGTYFDYEKLSCRDRVNVRCPLDRCAGTTMTYVNVLGDCQAYARCSKGVTVSSGHCPNDYFFDERSQGCTPINHNYIACAA